jgi:hypothetical protein
MLTPVVHILFIHNRSFVSDQAAQEISFVSTGTEGFRTSPAMRQHTLKYALRELIFGLL